MEMQFACFRITRNMYLDFLGCNGLLHENFTAPDSFRHPDYAKCACGQVLCGSVMAWSDLQPEMPHKPEGIQAKCRYPFYSDCPTDSLSQKMKVDNFLAKSLCLGARSPARDRWVVPEWASITGRLRLWLDW